MAERTRSSYSKLDQMDYHRIELPNLRGQSYNIFPRDLPVTKVPDVSATATLRDHQANPAVFHWRGQSPLVPRGPGDGQSQLDLEDR